MSFFQNEYFDKPFFSGLFFKKPYFKALFFSGVGELGVELAVNGSFNTDINGYTVRPSAVISYDTTDGASLLCDITGAGGGFTTNLISNPSIGATYLVSLDVKGISYVGGLKVKVGASEGVLSISTPIGWSTYTVEIDAITDSPLFELYRAGEIGEVLFDNLSVRKKG